MNDSQKVVITFIAALIIITIYVLIGWWALSWSTHTLAWLIFMGLSLGGFGAIRKG